MQRKPSSHLSGQLSQLLQEARSSLPAQLTPLIGREREVQSVSTLLRRTDVRLLTLSGSGGVGKTHLAFQVGEEVCHTFADDVCFVSLAPISDPGLVLRSIAQALGIAVTAERPLIELVQSYLRKKHLLLLLDNFEQVVTAAPLLTELLVACPALKILVTSRAVLRIHGEHEFPVPPLALPELKHLPDVDALLQYPAVALFVQRIQDVKPDFVLTRSNAATIAEICMLLDGLPLAIELAAARVKLLPPQTLLTHLKHHRLQVLTGGTRDAPERQQTLRNTVAWSYDLLNDDEQRLFRRLSVFMGGCTLDAAEAVSNAVDGLSIDVLDVATSLINKSLLRQVEGEESEPRLFMLETIREYGLEKLTESGELEATRRAHVDYYLKRVEEAEPKIHTGEQATVVEQFEQEHNNLRAALAWSIERGMLEQALRIISALGWFWAVNSYAREGEQWLEKALIGSEGVAPSVRAKAMTAAASLSFTTDVDEIERATVVYKQSLALFQGLGDRHGIGLALFNLGIMDSKRYNHAAAQAQIAEALALFREVDDKANTAYALGALGEIAHNQGEYTRARLLVEEGLALLRILDDKRGIASLLKPLGYIYWLQGDCAQARTLLEESVRLFKEAKSPHGHGSSLELLALVAIDQEEFTEVLAQLEEGLAACRAIGAGLSETRLLDRMARVHIAQHHYIEARTQLEKALAICREGNFKVDMGYVLYHLGQVAFELGEYAKARALVEEGLVIFRSLNDKANMAMLLQFSGQVMLYQEDWEKGQAALVESLSLLREVETAAFIAVYVEELGRVATVVGQPAWAAHLWGAVETFRISNTLPSTSEGQETRRLLIQLPALLAITTTLEEAVDTVRSQLGEAFAAAWNEGRTMTLEQALTMQVQTIAPNRLLSSTNARSDHQERPSSTYPGELTQREIEVLRLVAVGLTDAQVAEKLVVSPRTVNAHVRSILSKLNVTSRNAATRYAIENKLI